MNAKWIMTLIISLVLLSSIFIHHAQSLKLPKLLDMKFYFHRDLVFDNYLKIDPFFPQHDDNKTVLLYCGEGRYDLPYSWITPAIPKDITLNVNYIFQYGVFANSSEDAYGSLVFSFWRYRNTQETYLMRSTLSPVVCNWSQPRLIMWYDYINKTVQWQQGDRLILKLHIYVTDPGWFRLGFDCKQYPCFFRDPDVETLRPNAAGTYTTWDSQYPASGSHWQKCDDTGTGDGDTTYIYTQSGTGASLPSYRIDTYNLNDVVNITSGSTIHNVTVYFKGKSTSATYKGVCSVAMRIGGSNYFGGSNTLSTTYSYYSYTWNSNPKTGSAWTISDLNSLQAGVYGRSGYQSRGFPFNDYVYYPIRVTQVYARVEYTPPSASWNDVAVWTFNLTARQWNNVNVWQLNLTTRQWNDVALWDLNLTARQWQNVANWMFNITGRQWIQIAAWTFDVIGRQWSDVSNWWFRIWTHSYNPPGGHLTDIIIEPLIPGVPSPYGRISILFVIMGVLGCLLVYDRRKKVKRKAKKYGKQIRREMKKVDPFD